MSASLRVWGPALVWSAVILALTSAPVSGPEGVQAVPHVDKLVHVFLYLVLGAMLGRGLRLSGRATPRGALAAGVAGWAFGAVNEWIQTWVPVRAASAGDWVADVAGVSVGIALDLWARHRRTE